MVVTKTREMWGRSMFHYQQGKSRDSFETRQCCSKFRTEFSYMHDQFHQHHYKEFRRYHSYFRYLGPLTALVHIVIIYLLFTWAGIKGVGIFFAVLLSMKEIFHLVFWLRLEKRIFKPIEALRQGVEAIAQGNYEVEIKSDVDNDLGLLIASFNEMVRKLHESELLQAESENNRKMLIANISHDLKTPISAIQGYIEALVDNKVSKQTDKEKYLATIYRNTVYINKLIDDLFLFSKLDLEKLEFHFEIVDIGAFMQDLMEEYQFDFEEKNIGFTYSCQLDKNYLVRLDRKRFQQAIGNIITNTIKHGASSTLSIQVKTSVENDFICIAVNDNGPGISEEKLVHIFDRFYRIDKERTKDDQCTGLGLAIAKELVEAHDGQISVSSVLQEGTCFRILIPYILDKADEVTR